MSDEQLWFQVAENLTELSRRDNVKYQVRPTRDSVRKKLEKLNLLLSIPLVHYLSFLSLL